MVALARRDLPLVLAGIFAVLGFVAGVIGAHLIVQHFGEAGAEIGKSLMSLGVALLVSGAAAVVVKNVERARADRSAWAVLLREVVEVDEAVEVARRLIKAAHMTARSYRDEYLNIVLGKLKLRQVVLDPMVAGAEDGEKIERHRIHDQMD
jgi:hypothetical protein